MNSDFPRILSLLRKEKHLSQKQASADLGVAQALLSHYEKGKRECGLDFLVKAADYYNVSTDFLLGRSAVSSGSVITEKDISDVSDIESKAKNLSPDELSVSFAKKLALNCIDVIFSLLGKTKNIVFITEITNLFSFTAYKAFRLIYKANSENDVNLFKIREDAMLSYITAGESAAAAAAIIAISSENSETPEISRVTLERDYQKQASVLLSVVMNCEKRLEKYK